MNRRKEEWVKKIKNEWVREVTTITDEYMQMAGRVDRSIIKTFSERLIEADKATTVAKLSELYQWLYINKKNYTIVEMRFAREHFEMLKRKLQ